MREYLFFGLFACILFSSAVKTLSVSTTISSSVAEWHLKEASVPRATFNKLRKSNADHVHEVTIAVKQNNLEFLQQTLEERGTPGNPLYQQWMTLDEIGEYTRNDEAYIAIVAWLEAHNVTVTWTSPRRELITASAPIATWEHMLNTEFHVFEDSHPKRVTNAQFVHRCDMYYVPASLKEHITTIFHTNQVPVIVMPLGKVRDASKDKSNQFRSQQTVSTVAQLDVYYGISSNLASASVGQAVFETSSENFEQSDLTTYQNYYHLTVQSAAVVGITPLTSGCSFSNCGEGALDIQTIMGVAQLSPSTYWYCSGSTSGDPFYDFLTQVAGTTNAPTSLSISWSSYESQYPSSYLDQFNTEAMKLSLAGTTIFASTGDDGVSGYNCECLTNSGSSTMPFKTPTTWSGYGYFAQYPASCPYVVAVGATMGLEDGQTEIAAVANTGESTITTGGGFSGYWSTPSYQSSAVSTYLSSSAGLAAAPGYDPKGRGYPDLSFLGVLYPIFLSGSLNYADGTSCSAPFAAAMFTLVNAKRVAQGKTTVGYIHPTIYANANLFNDVKSGNNSWCKTGVPCRSGFRATTGWDPVTGLGSVSLTNLFVMFGVSSASSTAPSKAPVSTIAPSKAPVSTIAPSKAPVSTIAPSKAPVSTIAPSKAPVSTIAPSNAPVSTIAPSKAPVIGATITPSSAPVVVTTAPTKTPLLTSTNAPSKTPVTGAPVRTPVNAPVVVPTSTIKPSAVPVSTGSPVKSPSIAASFQPSRSPSSVPLLSVAPVTSSVSTVPSSAPAASGGSSSSNNSFGSVILQPGPLAGIIGGGLVLICATWCLVSFMCRASAYKSTTKPVMDDVEIPGRGKYNNNNHTVAGDIAPNSRAARASVSKSLRFDEVYNTVFKNSSSQKEPLIPGRAESSSYWD